MINVLVVQDANVLSGFLVHILSSDPGIAVIATASGVEKTLEVLSSLQPDVIVIDSHMPVMSGLEITRQIMETRPVPIVIVTHSGVAADIETAFQAIDAGALAMLQHPASIGQPEHEAMTQELLQTVKVMSEVKTIRRWPRMRPQSVSVPADAEAIAVSPNASVVAIGASTGGPAALEAVLAALPGNFPIPILIVQHMSSGFMEGFVRWLAGSSSLPVHLARHGEFLLAGNVYIAPDEYQMKIDRQGRILLLRDGPEHGLRPSVSYLFRAVGQVYAGNCIAGLLTGMGRDGANELRILKEKGAFTFAQDRDTSVVHGMPGEAIRMNAATLVLPLGKIAPVLTSLVNSEGVISRDV